MILVDYPGNLVAAPLLAALAGLVVFAFRLGELQNEKLSRYRMPLIATQYFSILILLLILWNPSRARVSETLSHNSVLAVFDTSESMKSLYEQHGSDLVNKLSAAQDLVQTFPELVPWLEQTGLGNSPVMINHFIRIAQSPRAQARLQKAKGNKL